MKAIKVSVITLLAVCAVGSGTLLSAVQTRADDAKAQTPPAGASPVAVGHTLFVTNCAPCHGADARGDDGPNLHKLGLPDGVIASTVTAGVKNQMPSFGKKLKGNDLKAVVAFVHSLQ